MELVEIRNLNFSYPEAIEKAIDNFTISISEGAFFVLCGPSGCGKSTLLRHLKPALTPHGDRSGEIYIDGQKIETIDAHVVASKLGFVLQSVDNQIVTDKVWHELAFGMESLGFDTTTIRRRVSEMASFFGIENWFYKSVSELSGGQKQLLNLASIMTMQPKILILDEPTSQLDPIAASEFLSALQKINRELGTTIILTEQRLEEAFYMASSAAVMDKGSMLYTGSVSEIGEYLKKSRHDMFLAMPAAMRIWASVDSENPCPVLARDGRVFLKSYAETHEIKKEVLPHINDRQGEIKIELNEVWFRYEKDEPDIIRGLDMKVRAGELYCLLGGNGAGKSTSLKLIAGLHKPYRGAVTVNDRVIMLPQNPQTLFVKKTVIEELDDAVKTARCPREKAKALVENIVNLCKLTKLLNRHPFDLSGGEQQRLALAKTLLFNPEILLLDEPTKGLDAEFKLEFAQILRSLLADGICILMVSHDIEFCAEYADRCALFFDGSITASGTTSEFFSGNSFYTTAANRMSREIIDNAITARDVISAIGGRIEEDFGLKESAEQVISIPDISETKSEPKDRTNSDRRVKKLNKWRKAGAVLSGLGALSVFIYAVKTTDLTELIDRSGVSSGGIRQLPIYVALIACLVILGLFTGRRSTVHTVTETPKDKRKLSKRTATAVFLIILLIPLTLYISVVYVDQHNYYLTAVAVLIECMLPFFMIFEGKKPEARELVLIASLCAIGIAGRAAFFMLPQFKPVIAMTIISGVALGGETGFLVGAVTMLVSNMLLSQGPWTPWQMFATGLIGFLAGILFKKGLLRRSRTSLCVFGAITALVIYGGIMNPVSALIWGGQTLNKEILTASYVTGFPMDCIHAFATVIFLWFATEPMLEKLDRIKGKYGLLER